MDEIYTDLDNYNDVNLVEELKNENKDLKFKLEEYSSALHRLQKDFDKLSGDFKNLEKNYSSLLKTARAEIERKTETIKNLNLEKDRLVINSLQKGKNILHTRQNSCKNTQQSKNNVEKPNSYLQEIKQNTKASTEKSENVYQDKRQASVDTVSSVPTDSQSNRSETRRIESDHKKLSSETHKDRDGKNKTHRIENVQDGPSVKNVMDRRKSMTFKECEPTFSSDDDSRKTVSEQYQSPYPLTKEDVRYHENRYEQRDHVMPESFEYYHPSSQPSYGNRSNRYNEFERQRNYDSYDCYDKSRRYYSPDNHHRYDKESSENYNQRDYRENKRERRAQRSPPSDRYNRAKSRDRRHKFERESSRDHGRNSYHNNDYPVKTKAKFEIEEPKSKRLKIDSYSRHTNENNYEKERDLPERHTYTNPQELTDPSTCQSPDYTHIDTNTQFLVKEIVHTALTPLQDPRLLSDKYVLKSNSEKPILMTIAGSNIDIVPINNPNWGENNNTKTFTQNDGNMVTDIANLGKTESLESGEIESINEDPPVGILSNIAGLKEEKAKSCNSIVDACRQSYLPASKEVEKSINQYKIPRLKKTIQESYKKNKILKDDYELKEFGKDFKVSVEGKHLSEKSPENINKYSNTRTIPAKPKNNKSESILQKLIDETELSYSSEHAVFPESNRVVNISTVEGDLELSDETSDNTDLITEDTNKNAIKEERLTNKQTLSSAEKVKDKTDKSDDKIKKAKDSRKSHSRKDSVKEKTRESSKKRRTKRKSDLEEPSNPKEESPATKENKEKAVKPNISSQTRNKFTDLFGDSNSLITPDDLGLAAVPPVIPNKYVSIFENTQDAVDLSVEDINMMQAQKRDNTDSELCNEKIIQDTTPIVNFDIIGSKNEYCESNKSAPITSDNTELIIDKDKSSTIIYENAKSQNTSNCVKTIIISSGIQPQCISDTSDVPFVRNIQEQFDSQKSTLGTIEAIATSTPYKLDSSQISQMKDSTLIQNGSSKEKLEQNNANANSLIGLNTTESNIPNESDVPDVRIFVKRRKKITKKPVLSA